MTLALQTTLKIKELSPVTISRIAAGEVLERPASAIKELVENAIDAGATEITIKIEAAGKNLILVSDNGCGMTKEGLSLAVERHTTSKLLGDDLLNLQFFGFRGEALPSIGAISRLSIKSRTEDQSEGYVVRVVGGVKHAPEPMPHHVGTTVEVHDLFYATPARLKFLRADKTEIQQSAEIIKRIALAHTNVAFKFYVDNRLLLNFAADVSDNSLRSRAADILGKEFAENSLKVDISRQGIKLRGYIGLPTYQGSAGDQYLYVNKRPVKDKLLLAAVRIAYQDCISRDKHPAVILFLDVPCEMVDVNVHPSKTEVRFRDVVLVRDTVISGLKHVLTNSSVQQEAMPALQPRGAISLAMSSREKNYSSYHQHDSSVIPGAEAHMLGQPRNFLCQPTNVPKDENPHCHPSESWGPGSSKAKLDPGFRWGDIEPRGSAQNNFHGNDGEGSGYELKETPTQLDLFKHEHLESKAHKLGFAIAQVQEAYILSQTESGVLLIDQHAAYKCLARLQLERQLAEGGIVKYRCAIPAVVDLKPDVVEHLLKLKESLSSTGLELDYCTNQSVVVTEVPEILSSFDLKTLLEKVAKLQESELVSKILNIYASCSEVQGCKKMSINEMNALLRDIEKIEDSIDCFYIGLNLENVKSLFGS